MFVVAGVTGNTGSVVAEELLSAGKKVRVLVRDAEKGKAWSAKGAEVAVVPSLDDSAALTEALRGASGVYLLSPPDMQTQNFRAERKVFFEGVATAVEASGIGHVVLLSSVGAQHEAGTGPIVTLHDAEQRLAKTGAKLTFVRAAYFLENWGAVAGATKGGQLPSFLPASLAMPVVTTRDIGLAAAKALLDGPPAEKIDVVELAGARDLSPRDVAGIFASKVGRDVSVQEAPLDAVVPTFTSFGISAHIAGLYREMYEGVLNGTVAFEGSGKTRVVRGDTDASTIIGQMI